MGFEVVLSPAGATVLKSLPVPIRTEVRNALALHLTYEPSKVSKSRIKRLRGLRQPQYRRRVGDIRMFYDVTEAEVQVLAIVTKAEAAAWLDAEGTPASDESEGGGTGTGQERPVEVICALPPTKRS